MSRSFTFSVLALVSILISGPVFAKEPDKTKANELPQGCADGEVAKWDAETEAWVCADDEDHQRAIRRLARRISDLEAALQPQTIEVFCPGESIQAALQSIENGVVPVTIRIHGVCTEDLLLISRDDVTLEGAAGTNPPLDGLGPVNPGAPVLRIVGGRRINLRNLELTGSLSVVDGASFSADTLLIRDAGTGLLVARARGAVRNSVFVDNFVGVETGYGAFLDFNDSWIQNSSFHGIFAGGGTLDVGGTVIEDNFNTGVFACCAAILQIGGGSSIQYNAAGITANDGARLNMLDITISDNGSGISIENGSVLHFGGVVRDNLHGDGIRLSLGSSMVLASNATISGNDGHGIYLSDTSVLGWGQGPVELMDNGGMGIFCEPTPSVAQVNGPAGVISFSGNAGGTTNCPGAP